MIVTFSLSNFRSFAEEQTISLVASNRLAGTHDDHAVAIPGSNEKVLRTGVVYGANGAGKSNLFKAIRYLQSIALESRSKNSGTGREAFRFHEESHQPSSFDLQFVAAARLYRFGLKVDDQRITEEWLIRVEGGRERVLYERATDELGRTSVEAEGLGSGSRKLRALATVGGPPNQSFLATVNVTLSPEDAGEDLTAVLNWFAGTLRVIGPTHSFRNLGKYLSVNPSFSQFAGEFLRSASTGVDRLRVSKTEVSETELRGILPRDVAQEILSDFSEDNGSAVSLQLGQSQEIIREGNQYFRMTVQAEHERSTGNADSLELSEESDGTRRLLDLTPALYDLSSVGAVYLIDEIDRSLHPNLVLEFLSFFLKLRCSDQQQLIVTTHESNLLDLDLLRRDEIWFAEKDQAAATHLYSLADFKVRKDLEIRKHYLQGRFGAVPFLGDIDRLLEKTEQEQCIP